MLVRCTTSVMLALGCITLVLVLSPTVCQAADSNTTISSSSVLLDRLNTTVKSDNKTSSANTTSSKSAKFLPTMLFPFKLFNKTSHKNETHRNNKTLTTTTARPLNSSSSLFHKRAINSTVSVVDLKNATQSLKNATTSRLDTTQSLKNVTNARLTNATQHLSSSAKLSTGRLNATSNSDSTDSPIEHLNSSTVAPRLASLDKNDTANVTSSAGHRLNAHLPASSHKSVVNSSSNAKLHITKRAVDLDNKTKSDDNVSVKSFTSAVESIPSLLLNATSDVAKWAKDLVIGNDEEEHPTRIGRSVNATTKSDNSTVLPLKENKLVSNSSIKGDAKVDKLLANSTVSSKEENANASRNSSSHVHRRDAFYGAPQQYQQPQPVYAPVYAPVYTTTPAPVYPAYPSYPSYQTTEGPYDAMAAYAAPGVPYPAPSYAPPTASYAAPTYGPAYGQQAPVSESYYTAPVPAYTTTASYSYVVPQKPAQASYRPPQQPAYVEPPRPYVAAPPVPQAYAPQASYAEPPRPYAAAPPVPQTYTSPPASYIQQPGAPPASATLSPWF